MKIKFYLINEEDAKAIEIDNTTEEINKALNFDDLKNTPTIYVYGKQYLLICSDIGKLQHKKISCIDKNNLLVATTTNKELKEPYICGNILISKFNGIDDYATLTDEDIKILSWRTYRVHNGNFKKAERFYKQILILD